jgi:hypothetical protein
MPVLLPCDRCNFLLWMGLSEYGRPRGALGHVPSRPAQLYLWTYPRKEARPTPGLPLFV